MTAKDGQQRGVDHATADLEDLQALRPQVRHELAASPAESELRHVMAWLWTTASCASAMTAAGEQAGAELRLALYRRRLY